MKYLLMTTLAVWLIGGLQPPDCSSVASRLKLPIKLKTRKKPLRVRWDKVEESLTRLRELTAGRPCRFAFQEVFAPGKTEVFFPLLTNLLKTAPEESLVGATVFGQEGEPLGQFSNRVPFEKQGEYNYTIFYFQFTDNSGKLQSSGNRSLIDPMTGKPLFLMKWQQLKDRLVLAPDGSGDR